MDPASIRTNNPGAQWMGPIARLFGATDAQSLPGGNNAAVFPDPVSGAAAQFALLGKNYGGMPLSGAIAKWSGGNSSPAYVNFIGKQTGLSPDAVLTPELLSSPQGLALAKAQAHWEAGRPYPLTDAQWAEAQSRAFGGQPQPSQAGNAPQFIQNTPLGANAVGQAQAVPYLPPMSSQNSGTPADNVSQQGAQMGNALEQEGMALLNPKLADAPKLQLPPAFRPKIGQLSSLATIKPFFPRA